MIEFNDPLADVIQAVVNLYGEIDAVIQYNPEMPKKYNFKILGRNLAIGKKPLGETFFPDDGTTPIISLNPNIPLIHLVEILGHEFAHVIVGFDGDHDKDWEFAFNRVQKEYDRIVDEKIMERPIPSFLSIEKLDVPGRGKGFVIEVKSKLSVYDKIRIDGVVYNINKIERRSGKENTIGVFVDD